MSDETSMRMVATSLGLSRRRGLVAWVAGLLQFYTAARDRAGQDRMLRLLTRLEQASDADVAQVTPRLTCALQMATAMLSVEGHA